MKFRVFIFFLSLVLISCTENTSDEILDAEQLETDSLLQVLTDEVVTETLRSWQAYKTHAWGHDVLKPLSKSYQDWYSQPLYISPIDAYSTLHLMGLTAEAEEIENYVIDSLDFNKDLNAKIFEVNIRILGGLLAMYEISENPKVLEKARDFADRMLPAFNTKTGIPTYWVNLKTGVATGDTVNIAEAGTYTFEMGMLSYYTSDPKYYQAGKKASMAVFNKRSEKGLIGDVINVQTGEWVSELSHICAGVDSYYEYLFKSFLMFGDEEIGNIWFETIDSVHKYISEEFEERLWYGRVDMNTGEKKSSVVTLYDAFFPAILALSGDIERAKSYQETRFWLWNKYGLEPVGYDYKKGETTYPVYDLNPEIIESAYYLYYITGDEQYLEMNKSIWEDLKKYCRTDVAFTSIENVKTMEKRDYMPTFFFAETLKYLYLTFSKNQENFDFNDHVFNTEAHQFKRSKINQAEAKKRLGFTD